MTRNRLIELRERRARLVERARGEREHLAALLSRVDRVFSWLKMGRRALDEARRQPLIVVASVALLVALRPRRVLKLLASGWSLWQLYRRLRRWWSFAAPIAARVAARQP